MKRRLFARIELNEMLTTCNCRLSSNLPCRNCEYYLKCDSMYLYLETLDDDELERIDNVEKRH